MAQSDVSSDIDYQYNTVIVQFFFFNPEWKNKNKGHHLLMVNRSKQDTQDF